MAASVVPWRMAKNRWPRYFTGCTLLGVTHDMLNPLEKMGLELWNGKGPGLSGSLLATKTETSGRKLLKTQQNYGVVGQGYNTLTGFPNSYSGGGVDPGFVGNPVFATIPSVETPEATEVTSLPQGSCSTQFTSSSFSTSSELYTSTSASLGASANYYGASFSANANYNTMTQTSTSDQQSSFILNGQSTLGGYAINAAAGVADPYYVTAVQNMCGDYALYGATSQEFESILDTFAESYGSSYINTVSERPKNFNLYIYLGFIKYEKYLGYHAAEHEGVGEPNLMYVCILNSLIHLLKTFLAVLLWWIRGLCASDVQFLLLDSPEPICLSVSGSLRHLPSVWRFGGRVL